MKIKVQIVIESEDKNTETVEDIALLGPAGAFEQKVTVSNLSSTRPTNDIQK